eukprot:UN01561
MFILEFLFIIRTSSTTTTTTKLIVFFEKHSCLKILGKNKTEKSDNLLLHPLFSSENEGKYHLYCYRR